MGRLIYDPFLSLRCIRFFKVVEKEEDSYKLSPHHSR